LERLKLRGKKGGRTQLKEGRIGRSVKVPETRHHTKREQLDRIHKYPGAPEGKRNFNRGRDL